MIINIIQHHIINGLVVQHIGYYNRPSVEHK